MAYISVRTLIIIIHLLLHVAAGLHILQKNTHFLIQITIPTGKLFVMFFFTKTVAHFGIHFQSTNINKTNDDRFRFPLFQCGCDSQSY